MCWSKDYKPLLSLIEWGEEIGIDPFVLAGISQPRELLFPHPGSQCQNPFQQFPEQAGERLTREDIADRLIQAEKLISDWLGVFPAPAYWQEEVPYPTPFVAGAPNWLDSINGEPKSIPLTYGYLQSVGQYVETVLEAAEAVTLSDPYGDGLNTRFSVTVTVPSGTQADQVLLYFVAADRPGLTQAQGRIQGYTVAITGTSAVISGHVALLVKPVNYMKRIPVELSAANTLIYASTVDIYLRTVDTAFGGELVWSLEGSPYNCVEPPCEVGVSGACFTPVSLERGWVAPIPASWDDTTDEFVTAWPLCGYRAPTRVMVNYVSGIPRYADGRMVAPFRRAVALLATSLLTRRETNCALADFRISYYRTMPTQDDGTLEVPQAIIEATGKQFGVMGRGAVQAYTMLKDHPQRKFKTAYA